MNEHNDSLPERDHLQRLEQIHTPIPVFFITFCTHVRKKILTDPVLAKEISNSLKDAGNVHGWAVGRYVVMPDHVHFFCAPVSDRKDLSSFIRDLKRWISSKAKENSNFRMNTVQRFNG